MSVTVCSPPRQSNCRPARLQGRPSLEAVVRLFCSVNRSKSTDDFRFYRKQNALSDAIDRAALAINKHGKRQSHQRRISRSTLKEARHTLLGVEGRLKASASFRELFETIERALRGVSGAGELFVYDTAQRIGAYLDLLPEDVYLHAGTREGARALGLNARAKYIPKSDFPLELQCLEAHEIEDLLCIYKKQLAALNRLGSTSL